jgi:3-dehydroquinate synthase
LESDERLLHGEAIAAGMVMEAWLSTKLTGLSPAGLSEITDYCLNVYGHQQVPEVAFDQLIGLMQQDKKNEDHRINFTLLEAPGKARVNETAEIDLIRDAIAYYNGLRS